MIDLNSLLQHTELSTIMARNIFLSFLPLAVNESNPRPRSVARLSFPDPSGWTAMLIYDATVATPGPDLSVDSEARGHHVVGRFTGPKKWETKPDPVIPSNHHSIVQQSNDSGQDGNHGLRLIGAIQARFAVRETDRSTGYQRHLALRSMAPRTRFRLMSI